MKIIGDGNSKFLTVVQCKSEYGEGCEKFLEVEEDDIKKSNWSAYSGYSTTEYGVICPVCGRFISIYEDNIPEYVREKAEEIDLLTFAGIS